MKQLKKKSYFNQLSGKHYASYLFSIQNNVSLHPWKLCWHLPPLISLQLVIKWRGCFIPLQSPQNLHHLHWHKSVWRQQHNGPFRVSRLLLLGAVLIVTLEADTNAPTALVACQSAGVHTSTKHSTQLCRTDWLEYYKLSLKLQSRFKRRSSNDFNLTNSPQAGFNL